MTSDRGASGGAARPVHERGGISRQRDRRLCVRRAASGGRGRRPPRRLPGGDIRFRPRVGQQLADGGRVRVARRRGEQRFPRDDGARVVVLAIGAHDADVVQRLGVRRRDLQRTLVLGQRVVRPPGVPQRGPQVRADVDVGCCSVRMPARRTESLRRIGGRRTGDSRRSPPPAGSSDRAPGCRGTPAGRPRRPAVPPRPGAVVSAATRPIARPSALDADDVAGESADDQGGGGIDDPRILSLVFVRFSHTGRGSMRRAETVDESASRKSMGCHVSTGKR